MFRCVVRARRGWTRVEAVVVILLVGVLMSLLLAGAPRARREQRLAMDLSNFAKIGGYTGHYALDHGDLVWGFTWKAGISPSRYPDLREATSDRQAAANQAVDIIRRIGGFEAMPRIDAAWIPHVLYSHLPLVEYVGASLPDITFVSTGDRSRLEWALDPEAYRQNAFAPCQSQPVGGEHRWPYSASYQIPPAWFDLGVLPEQRVIQLTRHNFYFIPQPPNENLGRGSLVDVSFPSEKVLMHDYASWHFGRRALFFLSPSARVPVLMADGSADVRTTSDSNRGWTPNDPTNPAPSLIEFDGTGFCHGPVTANGLASEMVFGHYRWTRRDLQGRDFGRPEVP